MSDFKAIRELEGKIISDYVKELKIILGSHTKYDEISCWLFKYLPGWLLKDLPRKQTPGLITEDRCKNTALQVKFGLLKRSQKRKLMEEINCNRKQLTNKYTRDKMKTR